MMGGLFKGLNLPGLTKGLMGDGSVKDPRAAFAAILVATAADVGKKPNFNLELEINDLWTRLGNLRQQQQKGIGGALSAMTKQMESGIFQGLDKALEGLLKNMK
jgi:hypothetical protein